MDFIENIREIHIGTIILEKLTEKSMTKTEFANRIDRERTTVRDILKRKSIDTELLIKISKALDYDFIHNVYFEKQTARTISISIKTEDDLSEKLDLFEEFILFMKNKR